MTSFENILNRDRIFGILEEQGWICKQGKELERNRDYSEPLIKYDLYNAISRLNPDIPLTDTELSAIIEELRRKTATAKDCEIILEYLHKGIPFKPKSIGNYENIRIISENPIENSYVAAKEVIHTNSKGKQIRCDILLYINGIPLVDIECKDPSNLRVDWTDAYHQIKRYQETVPELFKYVQIGVAADATIKYFPTIPWGLKDAEEIIKTAEWNKEDQLEMFHPDVLTNIIRNYTFIRIVKGRTGKLLPRFIQYRATEKIVYRVKNNMAGTESKNKGLIWHWQGSGKTLTMTYTAYQLYNLPELEKPTIFFVSDRDDLQTQLKSDYESVKGLPAVNKVKSIHHLIEILSADNLKGRREILTVLVQKFQPKEFKALEEVVASAEGETIQTRKNIVLLIDEAHRTQEGILSGEMRNTLLKNAFTFAFTGTPNTGNADVGDKTKNTFTEFSYPPDEEYLDKYDMEASNDDGFTLPLTYKPCLSDAQIETYDDAIKRFLEQYLDDVDDAIKHIKEKLIKDKLKAYKLFLENPGHIQEVSKRIVQHYQKKVEQDGFKAMVICSSRKACTLYKKELDHLFGDTRVAEVVMTYNVNEKDSIITSFQKEQKALNPGKDESEFTNAYRDNFKTETYPKILIVTDKLLAGFDADILQTIYLDKIMKGNKLLQAITRCNRPMSGKEYGQIIDFVGIMRYISKALSNYNRGMFGSALVDKDTLAKSCIDGMLKLKEFFGTIECGNVDTIDVAVRHLLCHTDDYASFRGNFLKLRRVRKFVESHKNIVEMNDLYEWYERVYATYQKLSQTDEITISPEEMEKIYSKLHEQINTGSLVIDLDEYPLKIKTQPITDVPKSAVNIVFVLEKFIITSKNHRPAYESLFEKIKRAVNEWKDARITDLKMVELGEEIFQDIATYSAAEKQSDLSKDAFEIYMTIKTSWGESEKLHDEIKYLDTILQGYLSDPNWRERQTAIKEVGRNIKSFLRKYGKESGKSTDDIDDIFEKIINGL